MITSMAKFTRLIALMFIQLVFSHLPLFGSGHGFGVAICVTSSSNSGDEGVSGDGGSVVLSKCFSGTVRAASAYFGE